jgi:hypothetical protein
MLAMAKGEMAMAKMAGGKLWRRRKPSALRYEICINNES